MPVEYFPTNFHFEVSFQGVGGTTGEDIKFQSVSGLDAQVNTETIKEGGENRFEHVVPTRASYSNLVLKRGILLPSQSGITKWCKKAFEELKFEPSDLLVTLFNEQHTPLLKWKVIHAWPKSWKIGELNAEKGEVLIETLELSYNYYIFQDG